MYPLLGNRFPIGTWGHFPFDISGLTEAAVKDMAACGFTLMHSPGFTPDQKQEMLHALDLCEKYGIRMILRESGLHWREIYSLGEEGFRAFLRQSYADFGHHPATAGFFLGDEPFAEQMEDCARAYRIALEEMPGKILHVNQLPDYAEKCREFLLRSGCNMASFDHYYQLNEGQEGKAAFIRNLCEFRRVADEAGIPMMVVPLAVGHFRYRVPTEDDFRWQMGVSLACGANAIFWYNWYNDPRDANYRGAPLTEFGDPTPAYQSLKTLHLRFHRDYAKVLHESRFVKAFWLEQSYEGLAEWNPDSFQLMKIGSAQKTPGILTLLEGTGEDEGKTFLMVTNNSRRTSDYFSFSAPAGARVYRCFSEGEDNFELHHPDAGFSRKENSTECGFWLAPGQFEIFRVVL